MAEYAGQWGPEGIEYPNGQHAANTSYEVRTEGGFLVPLYTDKDRTTTKPNPGFADQYGNIYFFANPGTYNMTVDGAFVLPVSVSLHPDEPVGGGGGGGGSGKEFTISGSQLLVQLSHGFNYKPAGIVCVESDEVVTEYDQITHPAPGITELLFLSPFGPGKVYVS